MNILKSKSTQYILAVLGAVFMLSGCISVPQKSGLEAAPKGVAPVMLAMAQTQPYRLQIGDVMDIKVMLSPELNDQVVVRPDGLISTTIARDIQAYGRTPAELQRALEDIYKKQLVNPQVSVIVRSFAPTRIYVTGEVNTPGEFITVGPALTLMQAISRAGGVKNSAGTDNIVIIRRGEGEKPVAYAANYTAAASGKDPASDVRLAPYDVVYVPRSGVADVYLHYQQYIQEFVPLTLDGNYQINRAATIK